MEEHIITKLNYYNLKYVKIENETSLIKIYNLFKNQISDEPSIDIEYYYYGVYYEYFEKNYVLMKKYYLMAIELNHSYAINNLGYYYDYVEKNYELMKKYYLMGIELNNFYTMYNLGYYYYIEKNHKLMKKYYLMAIKLNHSTSMNNLGFYYQYSEKNYDLMKKYYLMAIELNDPDAMNNLACYYKKIEKNYDLMKKYYLMAIELNDPGAMSNLVLYYRENNDSSFIELYKYEDKEKIIYLFNDKFEDNIKLDQKYYYSFLQWKSEKRSDIVKTKQYILRKTNIFPKNYDEKYLNHFNIIVNLNANLPKDILNLIAGHLFI